MSWQNTQWIKVKVLPWQEIEGRTIVLYPEKRMAHEMNQVGSFIWNKLLNKVTFDHMRDMILENFQVDTQTVEKDLCAMLDKLAHEELIEWQ